MDKFKKIFSNPIFNLFLVIFITFFVFNTILSSNIESLLVAIKTINIFYLLCAILVQLLVFLCVGYVLHQISKLFTHSITLKKGIIASFVSFMASGLLPLGSGAQVFQFYVLKEDDVKTNDLAAILWIEFILYQATLILFSLTIFILFYRTIASSPWLWGVVTGLILSSFVLVGLSLLSISQTFYKFVIWVIKAGLKLFKYKGSIDDIEESIQHELSKFKTSLLLFKDKKELIGRLLLLNLLRFLLMHSISFFVALSMGMKNLDYFGIVSGHVFVQMLNSFIPIPGASGSTEYFFDYFLKPYYGSQITNVLIVWRFITYFLMLFVGAVLFFRIKFQRERKLK